MKLLEDRILKDGVIKEGGVVKIDSFLNHQMDISLINEIGREFARLFKGEKVTKILTVEASGIGIACITAQYFGVPVVFAKKSESKNLDGDIYTAPVLSFTKGKEYIIRVAKRFLSPEDRVLIIDDFLAKGKAVLGLKSIVEQAGATLVGAGICIEKGFQDGGELVRQTGVRLESLAVIKEMSDDSLVFAD